MFNVSLVQATFGHVEAEGALKRIYSWMQRRKEKVAKLGKEQEGGEVGRRKSLPRAGFKMPRTAPLHFILQQICVRIFLILQARK